MSRDAKRPENYNLTVNKLQADDTGEYQVRATNVRGTAITQCTLTVLGKTTNETNFISLYVKTAYFFVGSLTTRIFIHRIPQNIIRYDRRR